jgi:hypothetical protein
MQRIIGRFWKSETCVELNDQGEAERFVYVGVMAAPAFFDFITSRVAVMGR